MLINDATAPSFEVTPSDRLAASTGIEDAEDSFLTLMLTQLQNQDPINPMDNGQFLSQLASFETASGIRDLESSFGALSEALTSSQTLQSAALVGRSVVARTDSAVLERGEPVAGRVSVTEPVEALTVEIADGTGRIVRRMELGARAGAVDFEWDGRDDAGHRVDEGRYAVRATAGTGEDAVMLPVDLATRVDSVVFGGGGAVELRLANGETVAVGDVREIS
jgi:flagellar basal-body rod modification protein FlgD